MKIILNAFKTIFKKFCQKVVQLWEQNNFDLKFAK
jgi:hypothetical protein